MEAACKTLVTQRLKGSGMAWTLPGGQAILTLRSLIHSQRWARAWALLRADFRHTVRVMRVQPVAQPDQPDPGPQAKRRIPLQQPSLYATLPLAV